MKKALSLITLAAMIISLCACGSQSSSVAAASTAQTGSTSEGISSTPTVTLSFGSTSSADDLITQAMKRVASTCAEKSGGTIEIDIFPASQLGDATAQMESLSSGGQDMFIESQASYMQQYGIIDGGALSFGVANTAEKLSKLLDSEVFADWEQQFLDTTGIATISHNWLRQQTVICSKKSLSTVDDFKGVKIRTVSSASTIAVYNALGFNATPISFSEVYLSLQQGVVDATFGTLDNIYTNSFYEMAPNILMWGPSITNLGVWVNNAKLNTMTPEQKQILIDACNEAGDWYTDSANKLTQGYVETMISKGAVQTYLSEEDASKAEKMLVELGRKNEDNGTFSKGIFDRILAVTDSK